MAFCQGGAPLKELLPTLALEPESNKCLYLIVIVLKSMSENADLKPSLKILMPTCCSKAGINKHSSKTAPAQRFTLPPPRTNFHVETSLKAWKGGWLGWCAGSSGVCVHTRARAPHLSVGGLLLLLLEIEDGSRHERLQH